MAFRRRRREEEGVNPTPLVDVMFNLLIFIIVTAHYSNVMAIKVSLPKAASGQSIEKVEKVVISVMKDGSLLLDGKQTEEKSLSGLLSPLGQKDPQPTVFIQADEGSTTGSLVHVMDLASKAGLKKISLETRK